MQLTEDAAKAALRELALPVPPGEAARTAAEAAQIAAAVGAGGRVAVKGLIAAGRRGKAGIVRLCEAAEAGSLAGEMLGRVVGGLRVDAVYIEAAVPIASELYLSFAFDALAPRVVASRHGGVDIEATLESDPDALVSRAIDPVAGLPGWQAANLWNDAGVDSALIPALAALTVRLYDAFRRCDATMLELNPLAVTADGALSLVGTMMEIDDNALFRHPQWQSAAAEQAGPGGRPLTAGERAVAEANRTFPGGATRYIELDGDIGLLVSGGGASLYQHDLILHFGGRPANHTDFSPAPTPDKHVAVLEAMLDRPQVRGLLVGCNFLQLARCDLIMEAVAIVLRRRRIDATKFPIVIRLFGPAEDEARRIAAEFPGIDYLPRGASLADACRTIVARVAGLGAVTETSR
ncbi:MAG: ATP-grasp domain-containing protein [Lautropia sp.]